MMAKTNFDEVQLDGGKLYDSDGNQVVGDQGDAIANVTPAADGTAVGTAFNTLLARLRAHGLIAT
jgi:hypothetical protein